MTSSQETIILRLPYLNMEIPGNTDIMVPANLRKLYVWVENNRSLVLVADDIRYHRVLNPDVSTFFNVLLFNFIDQLKFLEDLTLLGTYEGIHNVDISQLKNLTLDTDDILYNTKTLGSKLEKLHITPQLLDGELTEVFYTMPNLRVLVVGPIVYNVESKEPLIVYEATREQSRIFDRLELQTILQDPDAEELMQDLVQFLFSSLPHFEYLIIGYYITLNDILGG
jgi:hypothetical protein